MCYRRFLNICLVAAAIGAILLGGVVLFGVRKGSGVELVTRELLPHFEAYYEQSARGINEIPDWLRALGCRHAFRDSDGNLLLVFKASVFGESGYYRFGGIAAPRAGVAEPRILRSKQIEGHWFSYAAD